MRSKAVARINEMVAEKQDTSAPQGRRVARGQIGPHMELRTPFQQEDSAYRRIVKSLQKEGSTCGKPLISKTSEKNI